MCVHFLTLFCYTLQGLVHRYEGMVLFLFAFILIKILLLILLAVFLST